MSEQETAESRPDCYALLEKVFPMGSEGLREVAQHCWNCALRVECLRDAVAGRDKPARAAGDASQDGAALGAVGGFLSRWARLKAENKKGGR